MMTPFSTAELSIVHFALNYLFITKSVQMARLSNASEAEM